MSAIFNIDKSLIKSLNDEQARELVARLCKAELRGLGLPESAVTWGGDQRAKDGGVDVRVLLAPGIIGLDFVKNRSVAFQVKAENFPPSKISKEVAPKGKARPVYQDLKNETGLYVIVSSRDDCSHEAIKLRIGAMDNTLAGLGFGGAFSTNFYCARVLADWSEKHPAVATWIRSVLGRPISGWRPYGAWAYKEHDPTSQYLVDDKARVSLPKITEPVAIGEALNVLRSDLQKPGAFRIVGLSGVGKTRFVQAIFDHRVVTTNPALNPENVIYCDLSADSVEPRPSLMIEALAEKGADTVVVVDNCSPAEHVRLAAAVAVSSKKLKLLTIEYDVRDDDLEDTAVYRLEGASKDTIVKLLKRNHPILSRNDAERIAEYSDGNARVAFALAATAEKRGEFASLNNSDLFGRLFHQRRAEEDGLMRSAEIASLLYSFNWEDQEPGSELDVLAGLAECTVTAFRRHMVELEKRGLLQKRGRWRAVLPHAIANRLAENALASLDGAFIADKLFSSAEERTARSFSRRLSYLHHSKHAVKIAEKIFLTDGSLANVTAFEDFDRQVFTNLAPILPDTALQMIERGILDPAFRSIDNGHRGEFIKIVKEIAYDSERFQRCCDVLLSFWLAEPEDYKHDTASEALKSLFFIVFSHTLAPADVRIEFVRGLFTAADEQKVKYGLLLLRSALKTSQFSHFQSNGDFGARHRSNGWSPSSLTEQNNWFYAWLKLMMATAVSSPGAPFPVFHLFADALRGLWTVGGLEDRLVEISHEFSKSAPWVDGWLAVKRLLRFDAAQLGAESLEKLNSLEIDLRPRDLPSEIRAKVFARGAFVDSLDADADAALAKDASAAVSVYEAARLKAYEFGIYAARDPAVLDELFKDFLGRNQSDKAFAFGRGVGSNLVDAVGFLERVRGHIASTNKSDLSLIGIRGFIHEWSQAEPNAVDTFLEKAVSDEVWSPWFVELQMQAGTDDRAFNRLMQAAQSQSTPAWQFYYMAGGKAVEAFSPKQLIELSGMIGNRSSEGLAVAFDILGMVVHCAPEKGEKYNNSFRRLLLQYLINVDWDALSSGGGRTDYDAEVLLRYVLNCDDTFAPDAVVMLKSIINSKRDDYGYYSGELNKILAPFFEFFPVDTLDVAFALDDEGHRSIADHLSDEWNSDRNGSALEKVPAEVLIDWCSVSPLDRFDFAAGCCKIFEGGSGDDEPKCISKVAVSLAAAAPNKRAVVEKFTTRMKPMSWSGSRAAILESRLPLLMSLNPGDDADLKVALEAAETKIKAWIASERRSEAAEEQEDSGSFE